MDSITTGKRIAELRKGKELTQKQLADILGVSNKTVSKWETGDGYPDITMIPKLAEAFEVSTDYLLSQEAAVVGSENSRGQKANANKVFFVSMLVVSVMVCHFAAWCIYYFSFTLGHASETVGVILSYAGIGIWYACPVIACISALIAGIMASIDKNRRMIIRSIILVALALLLRVLMPMLMLKMTVAF